MIFIDHLPRETIGLFFLLVDDTELMQKANFYGYLCFPAPGPGPQPQFVFDGPGPNLYFAAPVLNFYFAAPALNLYLAAPALNLYSPAPALNLCWPVLRFSVKVCYSYSLV